MNNNKNIPLMKNNKYIAFHGVLALCAVAAVLVGLSYLWQHNDSATHTQASQKTNTEQDQSTLVDLPSPVALQDKKVADKVAKTDVAELDDKADDSSIAELTPEQVLENTLSTLKEKIAASNLETQHPMFGTNEDYFGDRAEMLRAIEQDPLLLDTLLALFAEDPHSLLGAELAAVIAETGSPEAQVLALEMARNASDYTIEERGAALLMVADMESITPVMRDGLLGNIQEETESDLTQFSLIALTNAPSTVEDYANVQSVLVETLNRDDFDVRRHASYQIGQWATSDADLAPLRTMAIEEPDINARARAIMSLGISDFKSTESKATLYAVVQNDENAMLRFKAWQALKGFQLSDAESADYTELGERLKLDVQAWREARRQ